MTEPRICAYPPCATPFRSSRSEARYCSDRCRTRDWKRKAFYGRARSVRTDGSSRSGPQLSYRRAIDVLAARMDQDRILSEVTARGYLERALLDALPARQRERLEAKR